ncbi:MAG: hypothetical protein SGJ15_12270 [Bacteroidota bacterium]|nr:hypothetical protein [Bacteroidota bacterium]
MNSGINNHLPAGKAGNRNKGGLWIALVFLFFNVLNGQSNYPINDPRNPNCPCHKYQKLADDEFKKLLALNNTKPLKKEKGISDDEQGKNKILTPKKDEPPQFVGVSSDNQGKLNKPQDIFVGISNDDLAMTNIQISNHDGDNILGKINENPADWNVSEQKMERSGSFSKAPRYTTTKHWKGKHKRHNSRYKQLKRIFCVGGWDIWKRKKITSACFHWR